MVKRCRIDASAALLVLLLGPWSALANSPQAMANWTRAHVESKLIDSGMARRFALPLVERLLPPDVDGLRCQFTSFPGGGSLAQIGGLGRNGRPGTGPATLFYEPRQLPAGDEGSIDLVYIDSLTRPREIVSLGWRMPTSAKPFFYLQVDGFAVSASESGVAIGSHEAEVFAANAPALSEEYRVHGLHRRKLAQDAAAVRGISLPDLFWNHPLDINRLLLDRARDAAQAPGRLFECRPEVADLWPRYQAPIIEKPEVSTRRPIAAPVHVETSTPKLVGARIAELLERITPHHELRVLFRQQLMPRRVTDAALLRGDNRVGYVLAGDGQESTMWLSPYWEDEDWATMPLNWQLITARNLSAAEPSEILANPPAVKILSWLRPPKGDARLALQTHQLNAAVRRPFVSCETSCFDVGRTEPLGHRGYLPEVVDSGSNRWTGQTVEDFLALVIAARYRVAQRLSEIQAAEMQKQQLIKTSPGLVLVDP